MLLETRVRFEHSDPISYGGGRGAGWTCHDSLYCRTYWLTTLASHGRRLTWRLVCSLLNSPQLPHFLLANSFYGEASTRSHDNQDDHIMRCASTWVCREFDSWAFSVIDFEFLLPSDLPHSGKLQGEVGGWFWSWLLWLLLLDSVSLSRHRGCVGSVPRPSVDKAAARPRVRSIPGPPAIIHHPEK